MLHLHVSARTSFNFIKDVQNYEARSAPSQSVDFKTFGSAGLGLDSAYAAWSTMSQAFYSESLPYEQTCPGHPPALDVGHMERLGNGFFQRHPVELLLLGDLNPLRHDHWLTRVSLAPLPPRLIVEFWPEDHILSETGPVSKKCVTKWEQLGYGSTCSLLNALQVGGVVDRTWLIVVRHTVKNLSWPEWHGKVTRPMQNCLKPVGIPKAAYIPEPDDNVVKESGRTSLPRSEYDPMPFIPGSLISTPRGTSRRLLNDEIARGLGVPKQWLGEVYPMGQLIRRTVALHIFEALGPLLTTDQGVETPDDTQHETSNQAFVPPNAASEHFSWKPPDLSLTSNWTKARVSNLISSALLFQDPGPLIEEGLRILQRHRTNYTPYGPNPTHLQLLWWEFPEESWDNIRNGSSMNFIKRPPQETTLNSEMADEQIAIAEEFIKELVSLGVLIQVQPGKMVANGPLFCLPKPGQPGQWRVLSDMKRSGQNKCIGSDPTIFPKTGVILDQLYAGGYSTVVDASKFFYNFPTRVEDRKYLGGISPTDPNEHYVYAGLPMGAGNSPSIAGRHGAAVLRLVRSLHDKLFQANLF
jgi:hypothetical protein